MIMIASNNMRQLCCVGISTVGATFKRLFPIFIIMARLLNDCMWEPISFYLSSVFNHTRSFCCNYSSFSVLNHVAAVVQTLFLFQNWFSYSRPFIFLCKCYNQLSYSIIYRKVAEKKIILTMSYKAW